MPRRGVELARRYTTRDLGVLTEQEAKRFLAAGTGDPQTDVKLAWELLYRLEPDLYELLCSAEHLHPAVVAWLPSRVQRIVEAGAGTGRLTLQLLDRCRELVAVEPAAPLRRILAAKLDRAQCECHSRLIDGFFDALPVDDDWADLVIACSAFTPDAEHGGERGLAEFERVCRPGGQVVIVWPNRVAWLTARGYRYLTFGEDQMFVEFSSPEQAVRLTEIFYPAAAEHVRRTGCRRISFAMAGINPPRDLAFKVLQR